MDGQRKKPVDKVTKADLIDRIWSKGVFSGKKSELLPVIDSLLNELKEALVADSVIELRGFGTFEVKRRKGREHARSPRTGETVKVENHGAAVFRPGKELKARVWDVK